MQGYRGTGLARSPAHRAAENLSFKSNISNSQLLLAQKAGRRQRFATEDDRPFVVENRVRIRFTRMGRKKLPFYRIVATDSKTRRDGKPIETLGWYNPMTKEKNIKGDMVKKWLNLGAEPSDTVASLLRKDGLLPPRCFPNRTEEVVAEGDASSVQQEEEEEEESVALQQQEEEKESIALQQEEQEEEESIALQQQEEERDDHPMPEPSGNESSAFLSPST